jgi:hypothetical protein
MIKEFRHLNPPHRGAEQKALDFLKNLVGGNGSNEKSADKEIQNKALIG